MRSLSFLRLSLLLGVVTAASFHSCTDVQIATLEKAIDRATERAYNVVEHLEANPNGSALQTTYYGTFDKTRYNRILTAFRKLAPDLDPLYTYDCACESDVVIAYPSNTYGYVHICSVFFNEAVIPPEGYRSQWATIIHESTHFNEVLGTTDWGYGPEACKQFAIEDPQKAVGNADNHANFAVDV